VTVPVRFVRRSWRAPPCDRFGRPLRFLRRGFFPFSRLREKVPKVDEGRS